MAAWFLLLLLFCARPGAAQERYFRLRDSEEQPRRHFLIVSYRHWFTTGGTTYRNSFPTQPANVSIGTTQEFKSSPGIEIVSAELRPLRRLFFNLEYGTTIIGNGQGTTHNWVDQPNGKVTSLNTGYTWYGPRHEDFQRYTESLDGRTTLVAGNVYFHVLDGHFATLDEGYEHSLDAGLGYSRLEETYRELNLNLTFSPGTFFPAAPLGPQPGLNSTYHAVWQGPHIGLREEVTGPHDVYFYGYGNVSPFMWFTGKGYDNLAAQTGQLSANSPNFRQAASGTAFELNVSLGWRPLSIWKVEAGYGLYYFFSRQGYQRGIQPNGSTSDITLDYVRTVRSGVFLGSSLLF